MRSLVTYRPNGVSLFDDLDRFFGSFFDAVPSRNCSRPSVDIKEEDNRYLLEVELPGMTEKDIEVKIEDNLLTISSRKVEEKKEERKNGYLLQERRSAFFSRSFVLPKEVDKEHVSANFKNGLLTLEILKLEKAQPKLIEVKES
ncbi:Small heat shock protein IbpB [subsurface metagenome]